MLKGFNKTKLAALLTLLALNAAAPALTAQECCCNTFYVGAFGGGLYSNSATMSQKGTAFFTVADGGPLAVDATGKSGKNSTGFGGVQVGYKWLKRPWCLGCSDWNITPAAEFEAYWYRYTKRGDLINPTTRIEEHDFLDSFPMRSGVYLLNGVFALNSCCLRRFSPYVGGGVGVTHISIRNADSLQVAPPEAGVNHFNSDPSDSSWAFAAQFKAGLRYNIFCRTHIFGEYRFLYVGTSKYVFGSTRYTNHVPTSPWNVDIKNISSNAFAFGIQIDL